MIDLEPIKARLAALDFGAYVLYDDPAGAAERAEREVHRHMLADLPALVAEVERLTRESEALMPALVVIRNAFWGGGGPAQRDEGGAWVLPASTEARITEAFDAIRPQIDAAWLAAK